MTELKVAELAAFVTKHEYVVVQMTSPDARCTYCIGADKIFDQASALSLHVPMHHVFRHGKVIGEAAGRQDDAPTLIARIEAIVHKSTVAKATGREETGRGFTPTRPVSVFAAMTEEERGLARVTVRHHLLRGVMETCTKLFPDQAPVHQQAMEVGRRKALSASTIRSG